MTRLFPRGLISPDDERAQKHADHVAAAYAAKQQYIREMASVEQIVEIGVRAGYSAHVWLSAWPSAKYLGIDCDDGEHGPWLPHARRILSEFREVALLKADSQTLKHPPDVESVCFGYVDGLHTEKGCRHDMDLIWKHLRPGGRMLVHDYDNIDAVKSAVDSWLRAHRPEVHRAEFRCALGFGRGEVVIDKAERCR